MRWILDAHDGTVIDLEPEAAAAWMPTAPRYKRERGEPASNSTQVSGFIPHPSLAPSPFNPLRRPGPAAQLLLVFDTVVLGWRASPYPITSLAMSMDIEELERLEALHRRGAISDAEFAAAKQRLLGDEVPVAEAASPPPVSARPRPWGMDEKTFATLLHLSPFSNYIAPGAGIVLPIVMWVMSKDESPWLDAHGKVVLNWMVSSLIYMIISIVLFFFIIGIPLLFALWICDIIYSIIGAVCSNEGKVWNYPMAIPFFGLGREDLRPLSDDPDH